MLVDTLRNPIPDVDERPTDELLRFGKFRFSLLRVVVGVLVFIPKTLLKKIFLHLILIKSKKLLTFSHC